jgi:hypothetical protein
MLAVLLLCVALPARSQQAVKLQFNAGQVTLSAQNAPIRAILAEWARLGGVTILNGDRVAGPPVTLELAGVSERQALDIVLRNVAGYMLAPRPATSGGVSAYDRIVILPTSVAPRNPPPAPVNAGTVAPRPVLPRPPALVRPPDPNGDVPVEIGPDGVADDADPTVAPPATPMPPQVPRPPATIAPRPPGAVRVPTPVAPGGGELVDATEEPETTTNDRTGSAPTPTNPFGIPPGSSARPGVISPVPPQRQQNTPNRVQ